jgi:hypothetical protein
MLTKTLVSGLMEIQALGTEVDELIARAMTELQAGNEYELKFAQPVITTVAQDRDGRWAAVLVTVTAVETNVFYSE